MENASKALLMAAGVLIGVLVLSLAVYLFVSFGTTSKNVNAQIEDQNLDKFNTQFTSYEGKTLNIHDVVTIADLATNNNVYYELKSNYASNKNYYIKVMLNGVSIERGYEDTRLAVKYEDMIKTNMDKDYTCHVNISPITKRVSEVRIN